LRLTSSVVSGSSALHVLDFARSHSWQPADLDIYTPRHAVQPMLDYLRLQESYVVHTADNTVYLYDNPAIERVIHLRRGQKEIDVIQSSSPSPLLPIPHFWSSHLMNYLTADGYCMAYPQYTLAGQGLLSPVQLIDLQLPPPRTLNAMKKYSVRGYDFRSRP
ncbi:hypothetical protein C2E23DRAFT_709698, partial [Lenzites betulinus]